MSRTNKGLFAKAAGVNLDVGCGRNKQKGFLGMDRVRMPGVDLVWNIEKFPWPVPSDACRTILLSRVWGTIEPKRQGRLMDELWRICRHDGQVIISDFYALSPLACAYPGYYQCPTEFTFMFYAPDYDDLLRQLLRQARMDYDGARGLPWKIVRNEPNVAGCIEVILEPYKDKKGLVCLPKKSVLEKK